MIAETRQAVGEAWRRAWEPREAIGVAEWAQRYRFVSDLTSARPGPWDNDLAPFAVGIMDAIDDPLVREVTYMKSSQVLGTEILVNSLLKDADVSPVPSMFLYPNESDCADACRDRVLPSIEASPRAEQCFPRAGRSTYRLAGRGMNCFFKSARSPSASKSKPIGKLYCDELDELPREAVEKARKRIDTFPRGKKINVSTPSDEGVGIDAAYARSDQRKFWVPCPFCNCHQVLKFGNLKWKSGLKAELAEIQESIGYECHRCKKLIPEHYKAQMLRRGRWAKKNQCVLDDGSIGGEPDDRKTPGQHAGFWINQLYSPFVPWARIAHEFVEHRGNPPKDWVNHVLAEPYRQRGGTRLELAHLRRHCLPVEDGGYRIGAVPAGAKILCVTASIDVQKDRIVVEWLGWGEKAEENWLLDYREIQAPVTDPALTERAVVSVIDRKWRLPESHPLAGYFIGSGGMATACAAIDTGHRTKELEKIILKHPTRLLAVKGVDGTSRDPAYIAREISVEGIRRPGGGGKQVGKKDRMIRLVSVTVSQYKEQLYTELGLEPRGSTRTVAEQASECRWRFPAYFTDRGTGELEDHDEYFKQLSGEYQVPEPISKSNPEGPKKLVWKVRPGRDGENHYLDVRVYHLCLRDVLRLSKLTLAKMLATLAARVVGGMTQSGGEDPRGIHPSKGTAQGVSPNVKVASSDIASGANPGGASAGIGSSPPPTRRFTRRGRG